MSRRIHAPLLAKELETLRAGDSVLLSGTIYTGRDAAHKRLFLRQAAGGKANHPPLGIGNGLRLCARGKQLFAINDIVAEIRLILQIGIERVVFFLE